MPTTARRLVGLVLTLTLVVGTAIPATADEVDSSVASARGAALPINGAAESVAVASAQHQASIGSLQHTGLGRLVGTCGSVAEIVGRGPDVPAIFGGFRGSPSHWAILTDPSWGSMGTGRAVAGDGTVYVSVVFCGAGSGGSSGGSEPAPSKAPAQPTASEPAPRPAASPAATPPPPKPKTGVAASEGGLPLWLRLRWTVNALGEQFGDLHRVEGCTLAEVVANSPEVDAAFLSNRVADPSHQDRVGTCAIERSRHPIGP